MGRTLGELVDMARDQHAGAASRYRGISRAVATV